MDELKNLRDRTGAGLSACKEALESSNGDMEKAMEYIRKKGLAKSESRADKSAGKGVIGVYEHGVDHALVALVEINCETDFVSGNKDFQEFAHNVAMQIAATKPLYVSKEDISKEKLDKEMNLWKEEFIQQGKPESVVEGIVKGKMEGYFKEVCLLEQPFFKDETKTMNDLLLEAIAKFGEKIQIKRFIVWQVGESR